MAQLTARRITPEHMDDPHASRDELDASLRYIRTVNRRLGGTRAALRQFERWARGWPPDSTIRILDVGTGSADIPRAIAEWASRGEGGHRVHITAIDRHPITLELAREFIGSRWGDVIELRQADALKLMDLFDAGAFDYAHAGMFLHHLSDIEAMTVLRIMDRLTKRGLIWNDLIRGTVGRLGVRLLTLGRGIPAMVRHDALVSIEAGFTKAEALDLAARAGLGRVAFRRHLMHRFTLVSEKAGAPRGPS